MGYSHVLGKDRQSSNAKIISRPDAAEVTSAWPPVEPDPQFAPGTTRPIELSEKDNSPNTPTKGIPEEAVSNLMAGPDTTQVDDITTEVAESGSVLTSLTAHEAEDQQGEPQESSLAAQEEALATPATEPSIHDATEANHNVDSISEAPEVVPSVVSNADDVQITAENDPDAMDRKAEDTELTQEVANQTPAKTSQEYNRVFLSLFRELTDDGPASTKTQALTEFNTVIGKFKGSMLGKSLDEKAQIVAATFGTITPVMMRADAFQCLCLIVIGELANELKKDIPHGEWFGMSRKYFPNIEMRDLQKAMRLANVRKAVLYCHLGKSRLTQLATIASKAPFSSADDPIGMVLSQAQGHTHILPEEYEVLAKAAIADSTLKRHGLFIDPHVLRELYACGDEISTNDISELQAWQQRYDADNTALTPTDFLRDALKNNGKRTFEFTAPKGKGKSQAAKKRTPTILNINSTFEKTRETIQLALDKLDPTTLKVDQELYRTLMATLKSFGETVFPS